MNEAIWLLDAAFRVANISMVPEGQKLVFAVPSGGANPLPKFDRRVAAARIKQAAPPAKLKFSRAKPGELLGAYAALIGPKAVAVEPTLTAINLTTSSPLNSELGQEEAVFALEALAALSDLRFNLIGDDKVAIHSSNASRQ